MQEVLVKYQTLLRGQDGGRYSAQACGRERSDGSWEGWLEFLPEGGGEAIISGRETTQPSRDTLLYWATGITDPYLDGALLRLQRTPPAPPPAATAVPAASGPARVPHTPPLAHAVLDPFHVYAEGAAVLRAQLGALSADQLRNIVRSYGLSALAPAELDALAEPALITLIMQAVEERATE